MKKLFICETPIQIIISLCIKEQCSNSNDIVDLIVTNTFNNYDYVAKKIRELNIFNNVYIANINYKQKLRKILKFQYIFNTKSYLKKLFSKESELYDELYFSNYDTFTTSIRTYLYRKNKNLKTNFFEEGYTSYFPYMKVEQVSLLLRILHLKNYIFCKKMLIDNVDSILLFEPDLLMFKPKFPIFKINRKILESNKFRDNIKFIFNSETSALEYDKKYIILEEFHPEYNDEEVFNEIINIVGKENVIIKLHPRRNENRFEKKGVKTLGNDGIPWEALAFSSDFSKKVLISIGSGSIISHRILFGDNMRAYLLFKFLGANLKQFDNKYMDFWNKLQSSDEKKGIHMPNTLEEFYSMLEREKRNDK